MRISVRFGPAILAIFVLGLPACGSPAPGSSGAGTSPSSSLVASASSAPTPTVASGASASASPDASSSTAPTAGRPYDTPAILDALQRSRRPGGVPAELQTTPIADQLAAAVWTYDGAPWPSISASGSCGPDDCTLDLSGTPDGAAGEDLYTFSITPADDSVELLVADLHGYPAVLDADVDAIARAGVAADRLAGLVLVGARWLPPPRDGQFVLSYRSGGEEGSPALDVTVDLAGGRVLATEKPAS